MSGRKFGIALIVASVCLIVGGVWLVTTLLDKEFSRLKEGRIQAIPTKSVAGVDSTRTLPSSTISEAAPTIHLPASDSNSWSDWERQSVTLPDTSLQVTHDLAGFLFLRNGELWKLDRLKNELSQLTSSSGKVSNYAVSPDSRFISFEVVVGEADEEGLYDSGEVVPKRPLLRLAVFDLFTDSLVWVPPNNRSDLYHTCWCQDGVLLIYEAGSFDVGGFYEYHALDDTLLDRPYDEDAERCEEDSIRGDIFTAKGIREHTRDDWMNRVNSISPGSRGGLFHGPTISPDTSYAAIFTVCTDIHVIKGVKSMSFFDEVWIINLNRDSLWCVYRNTSKQGHKRISLSPSGRYVGLFYSSSACIINPHARENPLSIAGGEFSWIHGDSLLYSNEGNIYLFDPRTNSSTIIQGNASQPSAYFTLQMKKR